jgi:hypothetical protein
VVCASPADIAEASASVASVLSWFFIWPLSLLFNRSAITMSAGNFYKQPTRE